MKEAITYVGLDVHKRTIAVCVLLPGQEKPLEWEIENTAETLRRLAKRLLKLGAGRVHSCYEAGPAGFAVQRRLEKLGVACDVIAPTLIPRKPGERIKTDRRDARKLAINLRNGELTRVEPPNEEQEAVRDLVRARDAAREDRVRARHQLSQFLDRRALVFAGSHWTDKHRVFLDGLRFEQPANRKTFDTYRETIRQIDERLKSLDQEIVAIAATAPYAEAVGRLRTLRGIDTYSAMVLIVELFEFGRFESPRQLMAFLGLVPSEESSGETTRRGSITKTGNGRVRRILIEAAQNQRYAYRISPTLKKRRAGQASWVLAIADRAGKRLSDRYRRLTSRQKSINKVKVAVARELAGFVWALLHPGIASAKR